MEELLGMLKGIRDACDVYIKALEAGDEKEAEIALGQFIVAMLKLDVLKFDK